MAARSTNRSNWDDTYTTALEPIIKKAFARDDADIIQTWQRYQEDRNGRDFQKLFLHYMPQVRIVALMTKRKAPDSFPGICEIVSDGMMGMIRAIQLETDYNPAQFRFKCHHAIRREIWQAHYNQSWAKRARKYRMKKVVKEMRAKLVEELGRVPTSEELTASLAGIIHNPNLIFERRMVPFSANDGRALRTVADTSAENPADRLLSTEVVRLAMKGLRPDDKKILKLILAGYGPKEIAGKMKMGYDAILNRVNGVLWEARCRADLATWFGVEPDAAPPVKSYCRYPTFKPKPARMVG